MLCIYANSLVKSHDITPMKTKDMSKDSGICTSQVLAHFNRHNGLLPILSEYDLENQVI